MSGSFKRPDLPLPLMRKVRQRCGYGCVICGMPLYEYDHIIGWAKTRKHIAEEITLLCNTHHAEKTKGLLPLNRVIQANENPFNLQKDVSLPYNLYFEGTQCGVQLGSNIFYTEDRGTGASMDAVIIDNIPIIRFGLIDGHLLLTLQIFDEFNNLILRVWENELVYVPKIWDIEFVGKCLIIREAKRKILFEIEFQPPDQIVISRARLLCNGAEVNILSGKVSVSSISGGTQTITNSLSANYGNIAAGIFIGNKPQQMPAMWHIDNLPRYLKSNTAEKSS